MNSIHRMAMLSFVCRNSNCEMNTPLIVYMIQKK